MDKSVLMGFVVLMLFALLALMLVGWRGRMRRQSSLPTPRRLEGDAVGPSRFAAETFYVATTVGGDPLERIAVGGLGFRARATVDVTELGIVLTIPGQSPMWIPAAEVVGVDRATWTIDRVVERDGLVVVAWNLVSPDGALSPVDSYFRFDVAAEAEQFTAAVSQLLDPASIAAQQGGAS